MRPGVLVIRRLRKLHSDESGFTLPELLTAMIVGLVVLMGAFLLLDHATSMSNSISDRQDAVQRGRAAIERMTTALRSQVCLGEKIEPITYGTDDAVTFYANLSNDPNSAQRHSLSYDPAAQTLTEYVYAGTGVYPDLTFPDTPTQTRPLLTRVGRMVEDGTTQPIFRFFAYKASGDPGELERLPVPLSAGDVSRVVMVEMALFAKPDKVRPEDRDATSLQSAVYVRLADPNKPTEGPRCL